MMESQRVFEQRYLDSVKSVSLISLNEYRRRFTGTAVEKPNNLTSCKIARSSTLQFPDYRILNHRIIVASFVCKGSKQESHQKW